MYTNKDHTFVVCAYKENPHIEETILSLKAQTVKCEILLSTSTPNDYLDSICKKHNIEYCVNPNRLSAGDDWNFAYMLAETELITIAHQDDIYNTDFLESVLKRLNKSKNTLISFTDYCEIKKGRIVKNNLLLIIKRIMNFPLKFRLFQESRWVRRRILSFGNPICCPGTTYVKNKLGDNPFDNKYINSCDYATYVRLADLKGAFVYISKKLLLHRIYSESATTKNLSENIRKKEDFEILYHYWPRFVARFINNVYALSEKSNTNE